MGPLRRVASVVAIIGAGAVAYVAYAAGEAGPQVVFGHSDANHAAADAWHQLPLHAALALGFAVAGPRGPRAFLWSASWLATMAMGLWATFLLACVLVDSGNDADLLDVVASATLLVLYGATWALSWGNALTSPADGFQSH